MALLIKKEDVHTMVEKLLTNTNMPFTNRVMGFPLPDNFKVPSINSYDGRGDPTAHIEGFQAHPFLHSIPDEIACRVFTLTLKREAHEWFDSLGFESIDNFDTLKHHFLNQFSAIRKGKQHHVSLFSLVQRKTESLEDFIERFGQEMLAVEDSSEQMILSALINGIRTEEPLMAELARGPAMGTLQQFMSRVEGYIYQEEVVKALSKTEAEKP